MPESNQKSEIRSSLLKYAANILSRRPYFRHALREKLLLYAQKNKYPCHSGLDPESRQNIQIIDNILDDLAKSGYLNDQYLAEAYVRRQFTKGYGPKIISLKLKFMGLDSETISLVMKSTATQEAEIASLNLYRQKFPRLDRRKLISKLYQRGYSDRAVKRAFDGGHLED